MLFGAWLLVRRDNKNLYKTTSKGCIVGGPSLARKGFGYFDLQLKIFIGVKNLMESSVVTKQKQNSLILKRYYFCMYCIKYFLTNYNFTWSAASWHCFFDQNSPWFWSGWAFIAIIANCSFLNFHHFPVAVIAVEGEDVFHQFNTISVVYWKRMLTFSSFFPVLFLLLESTRKVE